MKVIRILFDNIFDEIVIPNAIPYELLDDYITSARTGKLQDFRDRYLEKNNTTFPHQSYMNFFHINQCDVVSELDDNSNLDYFGSPGVEYIYYIGTSGNLSHGVNIHNIPNHVSYFDSIPLNILNYLRTKRNVYLMIDQMQEGIFFNDCEKIYKDSIKYNIPFEKIIISSDMFNFDDIICEVEKKYNCNFNIKYFTFPWAIYQAAHLLKTSNQFVSDINLNKELKLLCLNRRLKESRVLLLSYLLSRGYDVNSLISFDTTLLENSDNIENIISKNYEKINVSDGLSKMLDIGSIKLDVDDLNDGSALILDDENLYERTLISIVSETEVELDKLRFTEKSLKPILNYHPFIIYGPINILKFLKYYGFKTFDEYIDESYDDIDNKFDRAIHIFGLIDDIMKWDNDTSNKFIENIKDILIYNRKLLNKFTYSNLVDEYHGNLLKLIEGEFNNRYHSIISTKTV